MPLKSIKVTRWLSENKKKIYTIDIYEDDNIDDGINKIGLNIIKQEEDNQKLTKFYAWNNNFPNMLFSIDDKVNKWGSGYNFNPLKSTDRKNPKIAEPITYNFNFGLCYFNKLNIIFEEDFKDLKGNQYYFINKKLVSLAQYKKREDKLIELETKDISLISTTRYNIHRYEVISKLESKYLLADLYERLNTNGLISYIQWVNDSFTLVHKLHLVHSISHDYLTSWSSIDKITTFKCINCFSLLGQGTNSYAKITIDDKMVISVNYIIDLRKNISWEDIQLNLLKIQEYLQVSIREKITFKSVSMKVNLSFSVINVSIENLAKKISEYPDIFQPLNYKNSINIIYKRASNYSNEPFDYSKYVKNRILLGIDTAEIINELVSLNMTTEDAKNLINAEMELMNDIEQQMIKEDNYNKTNTIVIITTNKDGFDVNIYNIPNKQEFDNLIYWLSKIIVSAVDKNKAIKKKAIMVKERSPIIEELDEKSEDEGIDYGKMSYDSDDNNDSDDNDSAAKSSSGGALGKEKHSYFVSLLQAADKNLFGDNYARNKCQAVNQPVVFTPAEREKLIKDGNYHVDNDILYGSTPKNMNYYACPRLWCPHSKIPADIKTRKCPIEGEEPMEQFFENNPDKKRYVKLVKPNENDICAPCCFKLPPKDSELNKCKNYKGYKTLPLKDIQIDEKDENYLVKVVPVDNGRFGLVPQALHDFLLPHLKYSVCSAGLNKNDKCIVRKGIIHKSQKKHIKKNDIVIVDGKKIKNKSYSNQIIYNDSLIFSIAHGLNFSSKNSFIKDIISKLDLLSFLSIEDGNVCKAFMDKLPIMPTEESNEKLIEELKNHFKTFKLDKFYKVDYTNYNYKLSRLLAIFKSYKKFINYLATNSYPITKSPYYLYSLISNLYNTLLVVWEKHDNDANILCPYYSSFNDLIGSMEHNPPMLILLKDKKYYEPLELKSKNQDGIKLFQLNDYPKLKTLFNECSSSKKTYSQNMNIYDSINSLNRWIQTSIFKNSSKFVITTIVLNSDLTIEHFITAGNIFITVDKIGISFLKKIIKDFNIKKIVFYEDLSESFTELNINIQISDLDLFHTKIKSLEHIKYTIGNPDPTVKLTEDAIEIYNILILPKKPIKNDMIHARIKDDLFFYDKHNEEENKKWFQLQIMVFSTLIKKLNDIDLKELQTKDKKTYINTLLQNYFPHLFDVAKKPKIKSRKEITENGDIKKITTIKVYDRKKLDTEKEVDLKNKKIALMNKIKIILEEVPIFSLANLNNYFNKLIMYYKYDFLSPLIKHDKKQFTFSQIALKNGIPQELLIYHESTPYNNFNINKFQQQTFNFDTKIVKEDIGSLPELFKGEFEDLTSKWTMHKKSKWYYMKIIAVNNYKDAYFKKFFEWFAKILGNKTTYDELKEISINKLIKVKNDEEALKMCLEDSSLFSAFCAATGKKYKTVNMYWDKVYDELSNKERMEVIKKVIKIGFTTNDLFITSMSEILNINILTIHRAKYGKTTEKIVRGDVEDLILSSTFYKAPTENYLNRPILFFNKNDDGVMASYELIVDSLIPVSFKSLYMKLSDLPSDIMNLIDGHIEKNNV